LLPGFSFDDILTELRQLIGEEAELELLRHEPNTAELDMGLFDTLASILREADPDGIPMPMLVPVITDACFFSRLGIQSYGFTPMKFPAGFNFLDVVHAADERIPMEAIHFGARAIYELLKCYNG